MKNFIYIIFLLVSTNLLAQPSVRSLKKYMEDAKKGSYKTAPASIFEDNKNSDKLINSATEFLTDSVDRIRNKAFNIIKLVGLNSTDQDARTVAVNLLINGINDKNNGIAASNINALTEYNRADFDNNAKNQLASLVRADAPHIDKLAKLIGYLNITSASQALKNILTSNTHYKNKWAIRIALARMNDQEAIDYLVSKLQTAPVGDDFVYDIVPDLIYTRQQPVFEFIEGITNSEELNCQSADPDSNAKILCGYRVLEYIAYAIDNFPIAVDDYGVAIINNYENALSEVRRWFVDNPNYQLKKDIY